jgi:chromosome segregation ATPase
MQRLLAAATSEEKLLALEERMSSELLNNSITDGSPESSPIVPESTPVVPESSTTNNSAAPIKPQKQTPVLLQDRDQEMEDLRTQVAFYKQQQQDLDLLQSQFDGMGSLEAPNKPQKQSPIKPQMQDRDTQVTELQKQVDYYKQQQQDLLQTQLEGMGAIESLESELKQHQEQLHSKDLLLGDFQTQLDLLHTEQAESFGA